jgi:hypothetical protein
LRYPATIFSARVIAGAALAWRRVAVRESCAVAKLRSARERRKAVTGKCGGRLFYFERDAVMVALAKRLARYPTNGRRRSLRSIAAELDRKAMPPAAASASAQPRSRG